jgi:16S rRNA G1207 methylase RsmC
LREEIDQRQLFDVKLADSARDLSEAQYAVIVAVRKDIEIALNELRSMQARLAQDLILFVQDAARSDTDAARKLLAENQELSKTLQQERKRWRRIAERSRSVASASDADSRKDRQAAGLRQCILTTLDGVDQALAFQGAFQGVRTLETLHMP